MSLVVGILGMLGILIAFTLDEFVKTFNQDTVGYNVLNIVGGGLLTWYAWTLVAWPFIILNVVWVLVAFIKLVRILK
jgi:hypothetical protein